MIYIIILEFSIAENMFLLTVGGSVTLLLLCMIYLDKFEKCLLFRLLENDESTNILNFCILLAIYQIYRFKYKKNSSLG